MIGPLLFIFMSTWFFLYILEPWCYLRQLHQAGEESRASMAGMDCQEETRVAVGWGLEEDSHRFLQDGVEYNESS